MPERQTLSYVGNCSMGNDHIARPYTQSKKIQFLKQQMLLAQLQEAGIQLSKDQLVYDLDCDDVPNAEPSFMANISSYGSDALAKVHNPDNVDNNMINHGVQYVTESQQTAVQNSNLSAQQDALILFVIEQLKSQVINCTKINLDNKSVNDSLTTELERYKERVKVLKEGQNVDLKSKDNVSDSCERSVEIDRLKKTLSEHVKENESLMQTITLLKNNFKKEESRNIDREIALEKKIKQLDNIVFKRDQSGQTVHMLTKPQFFYDYTTKQALGFQNPFYLKKAQQLEPKLYDGNVIKNTSAIVIPDSEETLNSMNSSDPSPSCRPTKVEVPKELPKVSMTYKQLYDSIKPTHIRSKEQCDALIAQINAKSIENSDLNAQLQEKVFAITTLKEELRKLKGKNVIACRESVNKPKVITPVVHKVDCYNKKSLASQERSGGRGGLNKCLAILLERKEKDGKRWLGEYLFGGTCEKSATILLTYAEYFINHAKLSSIHYFPLEVDMVTSKSTKSRMYTFSPMMVANSRKHHCRVRPYTREVLVISTNLDLQKNHYHLEFTNRRGVEARIKNTWYNQGLVNECHRRTLKIFWLTYQPRILSAIAVTI
ncbi:hypothetical protein Tco_0903778 [Tanacetum coccineum]